MNPSPIPALRAGPQDPQGGPAPLVDRSAPPPTTTSTGQDGAPGAPASQGGTSNEACMTQALMIGGMILVFYFLLIRPQQKQEKQRKSMLGALKVGDKIVTSGGMHGVVASLGESTATVRVDTKLNLVFDRANIARVLGGDEAEKP